jgi:hypothetical protein
MAVVKRIEAAPSLIFEVAEERGVLYLEIPDLDGAIWRLETVDLDAWIDWLRDLRAERLSHAR